MIPEQICCVVTVFDKELHSENVLSCSGIILNHQSGLVLCSAVLFSRFLKDKECISNKANLLTADSFNRQMQVFVHYTDVNSQCDLNKNLSSPRTADLLMMVKCVQFQNAFQKLFTEVEKWSFYNSDEDAEMLVDSNFLSWFAVLKMAPGSEASTLSWVKSTTLKKGHSVLACGSPFGSLCPDLFMSTLSKGIVSNLAGEENALILTDARCLPGTEGGGLFVSDGDTSYLVGLITSPLCWKSNEWIGLSIVCSLHLILKNIKQAMASHSFLNGMSMHSLINIPQVMLDPKHEPESGNYPTVVVVESGALWGSGVMLTPSLLLTCRHVVNGRTFLKVTNNVNQGLHTVSGEVLYSSKENSAYDIAIVQLQKPFLHVHVPQLNSRFQPGEDVLVLSFGALGKSCGPSVTSGILSRVVKLKNKPVMLQTTCAVQCGASGGAVIRAKTGELLGIVSSNTRDFTAKVTYPHLNFSIPVSVLEPLLNHFAQTGHPTEFQALDIADDELQRVWRLQIPQSKL